MTHLLLYTLQPTLVPPDELYELTGNEHLTILGDETDPRGYRVKWTDVVFTLERATDQMALIEQAVRHAEHLLTGRDDPKARKHLRRIGLATTAYDIHIMPEPDRAGSASSLLMGIMANYEECFFLADGAFYNASGKRFLGADNTSPKFFPDIVPEESAEAADRKARTLAQLRRDRIPSIEHLPVIADSTQAQIRPPDSIVARLLALVCIAQYAEHRETATYEQALARHELRSAVSPDEWVFAHDPAPIRQDVIKFSQRFESAWTLAWVLGLTTSLRPASDFCDADLLASWASDPAQFTKRIRLQPIDAILDMTDLTYRLHWAVNDAELYGTRVPSNLIPPVVYERHYALNWVIGPQEWDQVSTDT